MFYSIFDEDDALVLKRLGLYPPGVGALIVDSFQLNKCNVTDMCFLSSCLVLFLIPSKSQRGYHV